MIFSMFPVNKISFGQYRKQEIKEHSDRLDNGQHEGVKIEGLKDLWKLITFEIIQKIHIRQKQDDKFYNLVTDINKVLFSNLDRDEKYQTFKEKVSEYELENNPVIHKELEERAA